MGDLIPVSLRLTGTSLLVAILFLATKGLGFLRDPVVAAFYGASQQSDAFYVALGVASLGTSVLLGALVPSVIPVFVSRKLREGDRSAWGLLLGLAAWLVLGYTILAAAAFLGGHAVIRLFAPRLDPAAHDVAVWMLRVMLPLPLLSAVAAMLSSGLNCYDRFVMPAAVPLVGSVTVIALLLHLTGRLGVRAAAVAVVVGALAQLLPLLTAAVGYWKLYRPRPVMGAGELRSIAGLAASGAGAEALLSLMYALLVYFGTSLAAGVFSSIQYGTKVQMVFLDGLIAAVSVVMYPYLARAASERDLARLRQLGAFTLRLMVGILVPATVAIVLLRYPLIRLVYQRHAFDAAATQQTATILGVAALSLVPLAVKDSMIRIYYCIHDVTTPIRAIAVAVATDAVLTIVLVKPLGGRGLLLAYAASAAVLGAVLVRGLQRRGMLMLDRRFAGSMWRIVAASTAMAVVLLGLREGLGISGNWAVGYWGLLWRTIVVMAAGCGAYVTALLLAKEEGLVRTVNVIVGRPGTKETHRV